MVRAEIDDRTAREHPPELPDDVGELDRTVEIVERQRAAPQQELAQDRHLGVLQPQVPRLDDVDPRVPPEVRVLEREHDRGIDLDRGDGREAAREVLVGRVEVHGPRLVQDVGEPAAGREGVVADADEGPREAGEPIVALPELPRGRDGRRRGGEQAGRERAPGGQRQRPEPRGGHARPASGHGRPPITFSSRSCARSYVGLR